MNLPDGLLDSTWVVASWGLFLPLLLLAILRAPWRVLADGERLNVWLGLSVALTLFWQMQAGVKPGLSLHLLGAMLFVLCFGWALGFLGLCLVLLATTLNGAAGWQAYALNALLMAGVGTAVGQALVGLNRRIFPSHFFVFVFANAFFGSAIVVMAVGLVSSMLFALDGAYGLEYLSSEYLPYFLLLGFSEAWLSGMVVTLFVVYRPKWVSTFEDVLYPQHR